LNVKKVKSMINKQIAQFPIIYTNPIGRIAIGWGAHETVADECKNIGIKHALIVTSGLKGTGVIDTIKTILTTQGVAVEVYDKITSNPKDHQIMEAFQMLKTNNCDGVISIGGGSSHDTGKAVRIMSANEGRPITDFAAFINPPWMLEYKKYKAVKLPQIAINTTAGTGAESTMFCTFTNTKARAKQSVLMPSAAATMAIVDPLIIRLMPKHVAAQTGFDAYTHGFESYVSRLTVQHSAAMELRVLKLVVENLRDFTYNRMNHNACEMMCWAANMGGVAIGFGSGAGIVHGLGHQISALTDCHHGLVNSVLTLTLERYNQPACPDKFAAMAEAMGVDIRGMTTVQASDKWFEETERLLTDLGLESNNLKKQFGLQESDIDHIVKIYANDFANEGNPKDLNIDDCRRLLKSML
jgi:formaldehyde dismutase / methanol dehydrogenase